ncbi:MAG TPA: hypothetical protein VIL01_12835 [Thermomicrobiales bacterium]|jgi:hypothetical protein
MDASEADIFDDLLARQVRAVFTSTLSEGRSPDAATRAVLAEFVEELDDPEDGPIVLLALAALQIEFGCLTEEVRLRALDALDADLLRWAALGIDALARRQEALDTLRARLLPVEEAAERAGD